MKRFIDDELNAHLLDLADDLVAQGLQPAEAATTARRKFGDAGAIKRELILLHPWRSGLLLPVLFGFSMIAVLPFYFLNYRFPQEAIGLISEQIILWWWLGFIILCVAMLTNWQIEFYGLVRRNSVYVVIALALTTSSIITLVLDVDNFEVNLHALVFAVISGAILLWQWKNLALRWKHRLLIVFSIIIILSALREQALFDFIVQDNCLYITPDKTPLAGVLKQCVHISWWHPLLYPIYVALFAGTVILVRHLSLVWRSAGTTLWRKVIMTGALVALPVTPLFYHDINNNGELDIVPWKRAIRTTYVHILGRAPEEKDFIFYAQTRSYLHMSRVREVLRASAERRIKITQLYENILDRAPTATELEDYAASAKSIKKIKYELKQQRAALINE